MEFLKRIGFSLLRIWLGYMWLNSGVTKLRASGWAGADSGAEITRIVQEAIARAAGAGSASQTWYKSAAQSYGLSHAEFLAHLFTYSEIVLGILLLLGVFTTLAACVGGVLNIFYLMNATPGMNPIMYAVTILLLVSGSAAGYYGIDRHILPALRNYLQVIIRNLRTLFAHAERV